VVASSLNTGGFRANAVGVDSTTTPSGARGISNPNNGYVVNTAVWSGPLPAGRHFLTWMEWSQAAGTSTFWGDGGGTEGQSGITGIIWNH